MLRNRAAWDQRAADYAGPALRDWAAAEPGACRRGWPGPTAWSWAAAPDMCRPGRPGQLGRAAGHRGRSARSLPAAVPLIHASAEQIPLADATLYLVISEYGASTWCDPYAWIPEAARVPRPGGQLIFLINSVQIVSTWPEQDDMPATETLPRPYSGIHRYQWLGSDSVEFHLGHGDMIRLLHRSGFEIRDLIEVQPPPGSTIRHPVTTLE